MFSIITLSILLISIVAALALTGRTYSDSNGSYRVSRWWTLVPVGLFILIFFMFSFTTVSPRSEGVLQTFGKVSDRTLQPGPHLTWPWQSVDEIDATAKADVFNNSEAKDDTTTNYHGEIKVRLADNGTAGAYATVNWQPCEGKTNEIFAKYRISDGDKYDSPIEKMRNNLVIPQSRRAVVAALATYNPTGPIDSLEIDPDDPSGTLAAFKNLDLAPKFDELSEEATKRLEAIFADEGLVCLDTTGVIISALDLPGATQDRINDVLAEVNKARQAVAQQATNTAQAAANDIISASLAKNPLVLTKQCFDLIADGKFTPPAGFSCYGASDLPIVGTVDADPEKN